MQELLENRLAMIHAIAQSFVYISAQELYLKESMSNSSLATISALVNTMIGGTMLTLPILFREAGILSGVVVLLISGLISYKTCELYVIHMSERENTIQDTIERILGVKWKQFFKKLTGFYLVCLNIIYIDLIVDQMYDILMFIFKAAGHEDWIGSKQMLVFDKFSVQYLSIIMFFPLLALTFLRNFKLLLKLTSLGVLAVILYILFIFYQFFDKLHHIKWHQLPLFRKDIGNLAGTCAIAFTIHTVVNPMIKANANQKNNLRDLRISYFLGFFIYLLIGVLGCLSVLGMDCKVTIINCYLQSWQALPVEIVYFLMLLSVYPCFIEVGRTRFIESVFTEAKPNYYTLFNVIFMTISCLFAFLGPKVPLDLFMNLVGSLLCFFFVYMIPTKFHWSCFYGHRRAEEDQSLISEDSTTDREAVCAHGPHRVEKTSKNVRLAFYGFINVIGVAVAIYGIFGFFKSIFFE